jgi:hypothetical protein
MYPNLQLLYIDITSHVKIWHVIASSCQYVTKSRRSLHLPMDHDKHTPGCFSLSPFKFLFRKLKSSVQRHGGHKRSTVEAASVSVQALVSSGMTSSLGHRNQALNRARMLILKAWRHFRRIHLQYLTSRCCIRECSKPLTPESTSSTPS